MKNKKYDSWFLKIKKLKGFLKKKRCCIFRGVLIAVCQETYDTYILYPWGDLLKLDLTDLPRELLTPR